MTVIFQLPEDLLQRRLVTESGCWEWQGCRRSGYGRVWRDGRLLTVHRLERYGVKPSVITCIKQGKTWGWVE